MRDRLRLVSLVAGSLAVVALIAACGAENSSSPAEDAADPTTPHVSFEDLVSNSGPAYSHSELAELLPDRVLQLENLPHGFGLSESGSVALEDVQARCGDDGYINDIRYQCGDPELLDSQGYVSSYYREYSHPVKSDLFYVRSEIWFFESQEGAVQVFKEMDSSTLDASEPSLWRISIPYRLYYPPGRFRPIRKIYKAPYPGFGFPSIVMGQWGSFPPEDIEPVDESVPAEGVVVIGRSGRMIAFLRTVRLSEGSSFAECAAEGKTIPSLAISSRMSCYESALAKEILGEAEELADAFTQRIMAQPSNP